VTSVGWEPSHEQQSIEAVLKRQVAGMIICPVGRDMSYLRPWQKRTPLGVRRPGAGRIDRRCRAAGRRRWRERGNPALISHGHRSIAFMGDDAVTGLLRLKGWQEALDEAGLPRRDDLVHVGAVDTPTLTAELRRMLAAPDPPSAVFSSNARCTIALVASLQALRRKDIGLVGFGDFPTAAALRPAVTGDPPGR
jgi:LacI family transcriptional regulator